MEQGLVLGLSMEGLQLSRVSSVDPLKLGRGISGTNCRNSGTQSPQARQGALDRAQKAEPSCKGDSQRAWSTGRKAREAGGPRVGQRDNHRP